MIKIRHDFLCPHCSEHICAKNTAIAIIVSVSFWWLIFSPLMIIYVKGDLAFVLDLTVGAVLAYLIFASILKLEKKMNKPKTETTTERSGHTE
jgi:hypothetical protein